ncbi:MAG: hypothetical protein CMF50_07040 [Legionellales bacterium]|mgnify:CR=1 FL=1|nr:hypothetical protein [Legionellales bacterium]|tara:strand:- start:5638 stop:5886 length:249 start_codon:yes stop_codon:yes gene_type:complete
MLLGEQRILDFVKTDKYDEFKRDKFAKLDELEIKKNPAFLLSEQGELDEFSRLYNKKSDIYFGNHPSFKEIIDLIKEHAGEL